MANGLPPEGAPQEAAPQGGAPGGGSPAAGAAEALAQQQKVFGALTASLGDVGADPQAIELAQAIGEMIGQLGQMLGGQPAPGPQGEAPVAQNDAQAGGNPNAQPVRL